MKKLFFIVATAAVIFPPVLCQADSYVVKVSSDTLYIDITVSTVTEGMEFTVFEEGEELVNPVTNASLGKLHKDIATGKISRTEEKYAVGVIAEKTGELKVGQKVKWHTAKAEISENKPLVSPLWRSPPIEGAISAFALCDIDGDGNNELAALADNRLSFYVFENNSLSVKHKWESPSLRSILSVDCIDMEKTGKMQAFVPVYNRFEDRTETYVLELKDGKLETTDTIKWLARAVRAFDGTQKLFAQEIYSGEGGKSFIRQLQYADGKFSAKSEYLKKPRLDWLYGFNLADFDKKDGQELVYITETGKIRLQFDRKKNYQDSEDLFGKTPNRLTVKETSYKIYPRIPIAENVDGFFVYAIANIPKLGVLADAFGLYKDAKLYSLKWNGIAFEKVWTAETGGWIGDLDCGKFAGYEGVVAVAVGSNDASFIEIFAR